MVIKGIVNQKDFNQNCVLVEQTLTSPEGRKKAYVLYIDGKPFDHTVSLDLGLSWFDYRSQNIKNPAKVDRVALHNVGGLSVLSIQK